MRQRQIKIIWAYYEWEKTQSLVTGKFGEGGNSKGRPRENSWMACLHGGIVTTTQSDNLLIVWDGELWLSTLFGTSHDDDGNYHHFVFFALCACHVSWQYRNSYNNIPHHAAMTWSSSNLITPCLTRFLIVTGLVFPCLSDIFAFWFSFKFIISLIIEFSTSCYSKIRKCMFMVSYRNLFCCQ